jgi:DNA helicase II / ATP-dependent DNA helicase PcrA
VTASTVASARPVLRIETPQDLQAVMQADFAPSPQQWAAITAPLSPAVVIAGAGSGKTTLMAARVVHLVVTGQVRPDQILGLTFTTKAAGELRTRIRAALVTAGVLDTAPRDDEEDVLEPTVATYNAYAANLLTEHGLRIGHEPDTRVVTDAARYQLGARVVDRYTGVVQHLTDHPETAIQNLLALDATMSEHLRSPDEVRAFDAAQRPGFLAARLEEEQGRHRATYLAEIDKAISAIDRRGELLGLVESYRRLKADLGLMDFSDQIALGARLADEQPDVGAAERDKFRVVLLDEYQDTSVAQALMLSRLFSGPDEASGLGHAVTAVGDPNQAIYGWRGASVSNILNFADTFPAARGDVPVLPLTVNRRSDARILDLANVLARPLYDAFPQVSPLVAKDGAAPGLVQTQVFETHREELTALVERVRDAHDKTGDWSRLGVLTRDNAHAEEVFDALTSADVPVEIVGLSGLLRLPEVAEIVATLRLMHDVTANASLLTLLTGPRWAVGPRDLHLLARRAAELSGGRGRPAEAADVADQLLEIADGIDPAEVPALGDALEDPGADLPYSAEARERFALLAGELRMLRSHVAEPLLDVVRRVIDTSGVDIELASAVGPAAVARRDNLDLFVKAVAEFQAVDGDVSLAALLAYLTAEDDQGNGLDAATPTEADSVKLLTVHRSKGLEWHSVFLVGVGETRFPSSRGRTLWTSSPCVMPAPLRGDAGDLPQLQGYDKAALDAYRAAAKQHEATEELRLGYVAFTRAEHEMRVTSFLWNTRKTPFGPSPFQETMRDVIEGWGEQVAGWLDKPPRDATHPYAGDDPSRPWPLTGIGREARLRLAAAEAVRAADVGAPDEGLDVLTAGQVADWDAAIERLLAEARADRGGQIRVELPSSLSATAMSRLRDDPQLFARELARPMPRKPSSAARFGTRFHAWVESRFGQPELIPYDELEGRADACIDDESELAELVARFESGPYADRVPHAVEAPFALVLAGQVVRGRIDAVYSDVVDGERWFEVVDWKTNRAATADPLQLAVYRLAWAELTGTPLDRVRAVFHYVRSGQTVEPDDLPGRAELERIVRG